MRATPEADYMQTITNELESMAKQVARLTFAVKNHPYWHVKLMTDDDPYPTREWIVFRHTKAEAETVMKRIMPDVLDGYFLVYSEVNPEAHTGVYEI